MKQLRKSECVKIASRDAIVHFSTTMFDVASALSVVLVSLCSCKISKDSDL